MRIRPSAALAWGLWLVYAVCSVIGFLGEDWRGGAGKLASDAAFYVAFATFATVGVVVAWRRPRNPLGWVFLSVGVLSGIGGFTKQIADSAAQGDSVPATAVLAGWVQAWFWYPLIALATVFTLLLFPSGLPSRRWRPVLWVVVASLASIVVAAGLTPTIDVAGRPVRNPVGLSLFDAPNLEETALFHAFEIVIAGALLASMVSQVLRFRRSRGDERQQPKWFVYAAALLVLSIAASVASPEYDQSDVSTAVTGLALCALPVAIGIAILRYRLYDIDRLINRTIVYGLLTAILAGVYLGLAVGLGSLMGRENSLVIAGSTLVVAALFRPARHRIQGFIDRRFYRGKYDAARTLEAFTARLRDEVDLESLTGDLMIVVQDTMQPAQASLWLRQTSR